MRDRSSVIAAVPTPFTAAGDLDLGTAAALFRFLAASVGQVFVAGTTGEFPALDDAERLALFEAALREFGPDGVIAHVGAADAHRAARLAAGAVGLGVRRLSAITPHYLPARADEVTRYFAAVRAAAPEAELYAYLYPDRTGIAVSPEQLAALAEATGLAGAKVSGAASRDLAAYVAALPGLPVLSGDDSDLAATLRAGGAGIVSGLSSVFPETYAALAVAVAAGDAVAADPHQRAVARMSAALGSSIGRFKVALRLRGFGDGTARMAVGAPAPAESAAIARLVADLAPTGSLVNGS